MLGWAARRHTYFVHHNRTVARIVEQRPRWMLAERVDDGNRVRRIERVFQDSGIAEHDVKLDEHQFPPITKAS